MRGRAKPECKPSSRSATATALPQLDCGIQLAEKYPVLYATIGIHPHEARLADEAAYQDMETLAQHPKVIAWGEIGLDYFYDHSVARCAEEGFHAADGVGRRRETTDRDSLPSVGWQR